eukprot:jgi/Pico_ML_1/54614/g506.t1
MQLTVSTEEGQVFNLEVDPAELVENVKAILEAETGISMNSQKLLHEGKLLQDLDTLSGPSGGTPKAEKIPAPPTAASRQGGSEPSIQKLTQLGFSRSQAVEALQACEGDVDKAASLLFGGF